MQTEEQALAAVFGTPRDELAARLVGEPGTGKSTAHIQAAMALGRPYSVANSDPGCTSDRYTGGYKPLAGVWDWQDGVILKEMQRGGMLIINDVQLMGPDGWAAMMLALDLGMGGAYTRDDGVTITAHPEYLVGLTMNGNPKRLDYAIRSRIRTTIEVSEPSSEMLMALLLGGTDDTIAEACAADYEAGPKRVGEYREWKALADHLNRGVPCALAIGWTFYDGSGNYGRCQAVAKALHVAGYAGATKVVQSLAGQMAGGPPSMTVGS
jgi:hypothetical protein